MIIYCSRGIREVAAWKIAIKKKSGNEIQKIFGNDQIGYMEKGERKNEKHKSKVSKGRAKDRENQCGGNFH